MKTSSSMVLKEMWIKCNFMFIKLTKDFYCTSFSLSYTVDGNILVAKYVKKLLYAYGFLS